LLQSLVGLVAVLAGAAATDLFQSARAERERRNRLLTRYLAQLQDACESLWYRLRNLAYERASLESSEPYLVTTTMYTLGRALGVERMLSLEGLYPEIWKGFPQLKEPLSRRRIDRAVGETTKAQGVELQHYDRLALAEAAIERHDEEFRPSTFLDFRRRIEGSESEWWQPARKAVTALQDSEDRVRSLMEDLENLVLALSKVTEIDSALPEERDGTPGSGVAEPIRVKPPGRRPKKT